MSKKRTPDQEVSETPSAVAEPPAAEAGADKPSFAERVARSRRAPDPFGIATDNVAGVRLLESREDRQIAIKFGQGRPEDKPSTAVIEKLKDAGYRWNPKHRIWAHAVGSDSAMSTRIDAERLYQEIRGMIRAEKGIDASPEVPF